jgi:uncharacterized protein (TIGR02246 family)
MSMIRLTPPTYLMLFFTSACCIAYGHESSADETEAVAARVQAYVTAFNQRDLDACAEHWSETAEYVLPASGARVRGRKAIREALQKLLGTEERFKLTVSDQRFRQVSRDVVLEEGNATVVSARHGIERADYVVVHVKIEGKWYRDSVRETTSAAPQVSGSQLHELAWLLGEWRAENNQGTVDIHGKWMNDKRFISRIFKVRGKDGYKLHGTQIVGWDPKAGVIRSWSFDSEGGFEQAVWTRDDERWLVKATAVLPDGSVGSEQRLVTQEGDGRMSTKVIEQQVSGQLLPGSEKVTLVRQTED